MYIICYNFYTANGKRIEMAGKFRNRKEWINFVERETDRGNEVYIYSIETEAKRGEFMQAQLNFANDVDSL